MGRKKAVLIPYKATTYMCVYIQTYTYYDVILYTNTHTRLCLHHIVQSIFFSFIYAYL